MSKIDELLEHLEAGRSGEAGLEAAATIRALREALDFYASNHEWPNEGPWGVDSTDFGNVARTALASHDGREG